MLLNKAIKISAVNVPLPLYSRCSLSSAEDLKFPHGPPWLQNVRLYILPAGQQQEGIVESDLEMGSQLGRLIDELAVIQDNNLYPRILKQHVCLYWGRGGGRSARVDTSNFVSSKE